MDFDGILEFPRDGVIKFTSRWTKGNCVSSEMIRELREYRKELFRKQYIGVGADRIGYGNMSRRWHVPSGSIQDTMHQDGFIITGSQTGHLLDPGVDAYSYVAEWSSAGNWVQCVGDVQASSESLTHAALYEFSDEIQAVIHIHSNPIWTMWPDSLPITDHHVVYGTPAMAVEMRRILKSLPNANRGAICMKGHQDGVIVWGASLAEAMGQIHDLERKLNLV